MVSSIYSCFVLVVVHFEDGVRPSPNPFEILVESFLTQLSSKLVGHEEASIGVRFFFNIGDALSLLSD